MKRLTLVPVALCLITLCRPALSSAAQEQMPYELRNVAERKELEEASHKLSTALLRGDTKGVLVLLAPDFDLGRYQYQKRDLGWMRRFLPQRFKRIKFAFYEISVSHVSVMGARAIVTGQMMAENDHDESSPTYKVLGTLYTAIWKNTASGWRLERSDEFIEPLLEFDDSLPPKTQAIKLSSTLASADVSSLPEQNPFCVLDQPFMRVTRGGGAFAFSTDGKVLASAYYRDGLHLSDVKSGALLLGMKRHHSRSYSMTITPDAMLVTGENGDVKFYNGRNDTTVRGSGLMCGEKVSCEYGCRVLLSLWKRVADEGWEDCRR